MTVPVRLALFGALLAGRVRGRRRLGGVVDPETDTTSGGHAATPTAPSADSHGQMDEQHGTTDARRRRRGGRARSEGTLPGLASASDGMRLVLTATTTQRGTSRPHRPASRRSERRRPSVTSTSPTPSGCTRSSCAATSPASSTCIPPRRPDGSWRTVADLSAAGSYRRLRRLHRRRRAAHARRRPPGRGSVLPDRAARPGHDGTLRPRRERPAHQDGTDRVAFTVARDGVDVTSRLQSYLGARGHLVALRAGDLAYLHTHPDGDRARLRDRPARPHGPYRLFVQFRLDGEVHTAAFTQEVTS